MQVKIFSVTDDVKGLVSVIREWFAESQKTEFGLNVDIYAAILNVGQLIFSPNSDILVLIDDNETIVGFFGISVSQSKFSNQKIAEERYYYVVQTSRGHSSLRLLKVAEEWAKNNGCSHFIVYASQLAGGLHNRTCKLYEKMGLTQFETSYIKEL